MRYIKVLLFLLSVMLSSQIYAGWERTYGGNLNDRVNALIQTADGNYIIAGRTESFGFGTSGSHVVYVLKINDSGDTLWTKTYGLDYDEAHCAIESDDGSIYIAGSTYSYSSGSSDVWLLKLNSEGDSLWTKTYGGPRADCCHDMILSQDSCIILVGDVDASPSDSKTWLAKVDLEGETIWSNDYGPSGVVQPGKCGLQLDDESLIVVSTKFVSGGYSNILLLKTDVLGDTLITKEYGSSYNDWGSEIVALEEGFVIVGTSSQSTGLDNADGWVMKFDEFCDTLLTKKFRIEGQSTRANSITPTSDGGYIVAGTYGSFMYANAKIFLSKLDTDLNILWTESFGSSGYNDGKVVIETSDDGFILCANTNSLGEGGYDIYVIRTDSLGSSTIEEDKNLPRALGISAHPNPFNSAVTITLDCHSRAIGNPEGFAIEIYDVSGRLVEPVTEPVEVSVGAGLVPARSTGEHKGLPYEFVWHPAPSLGSGVYLVRATVGDQTATKRVVYLK